MKFDVSYDPLMQAIETRWLDQTDTKGSRIVARCEAKRIIVGYDHRLDPVTNHRAAALNLIRALGWYGTWCSGSVPSLPNSYVHVNMQRYSYEDGWRWPGQNWVAMPDKKGEPWQNWVARRDRGTIRKVT